MFKKIIQEKEMLALALALIVLAFSNSFSNLGGFASSIIMFLLILVVSVGCKKISAHYLELETEEKIWSFQRYGFDEKDHFKNPIPIGIFLPVILSFFSMGYLKWFAVSMTDLKPKKQRAVRKHGYYSYAELTEWHIALISAASIVGVMILSFFSYNFGFSELSKLCVYFAFFNLLPIGRLDGTRIFFGSKILWLFLMIFVLTSLGFVMFI